MAGTSILQWGISITVPAIAGLCGVLLGGFLTVWRENATRRHEWASKQLTEFYPPLLAIRRELRALGETRVRIGGVANTVWQEKCRLFEGQPQELERLSRDEFPGFQRTIEHENQALINESMPAYHKMVDVFRAKMWLAEPSTVAHFPLLLAFVNVWDRYLAGSLPGEVADRLEANSEDTLEPLYQDLEQRHEELRTKIAGRRPSKRQR